MSIGVPGPTIGIGDILGNSQTFTIQPGEGCVEATLFGNEVCDDCCGESDQKKPEEQGGVKKKPIGEE